MEQKSSEITENESLKENAENQPNQKMMGFGQAVKTCFKKYLSFRGCATRAEYWWFSLFAIVGQTLLMIPLILSYRVYFRIHTMNALLAMIVFSCLVLLFNVTVMLPLLSAGVRRMHDTGNAGFMFFIPILNFIISLLPSKNTSEYRSGYNIHPVRNALGKAIFIFSLVSYLLYMGSLLTNAVRLSLGSVWDYTSKISQSDDDFSDFPDKLPPVSQERLEEILAEIVERENRIVTEEERNEPFEEENCVYHHANGNTSCIVVSEKSPYWYNRLINPDPNNGLPNYLYVAYGRPTKGNMRVMTGNMMREKEETAQENTVYDSVDFKGFYKGSKEYSTISFSTTVTIGGMEYEAFFSDID